MSAETRIMCPTEPTVPPTDEHSTSPEESERSTSLALPLQTAAPVPVYLTQMSTGVSRAGAYNALRVLVRLMGSDARPEDFPWHQLRFEHTQELRTRLMAKYAPGSARTYMSSLRGVLKTCARLGIMTYEDLHRALDVKPVKGSRTPPGKMLSEAEEQQLFSYVARLASPHRERDAALLALGVSTGLRREELANAVFDKLVGNRLTVVGKGNKERAVYVPPEAYALLQTWIHVRGQAPGPLFTPFTSSRTLVFDRHMTPANVWLIVKGIRDVAGVQFTPHDLRRTCISQMFEAGIDGSAIQRNAGHADFSTTSGYDRRGDAVLATATAKTDVAGGWNERIRDGVVPPKKS
jgi:integrase